MRLKIISDGTPMGTQVVDAETGEPLEGVSAVSWAVSMGTVATGSIFMLQITIEAVGLFQEVKPQTDD
jgi:hypothetical protein